jgi:hypothetical protein
MTTIVLASTLYGLATAVTVLDNVLPSKDGRRVLVMANNAPLAEVVPDLNELDGFDALADRFDNVVSLNELIAPYHPSEWRPSTEDLVILQRLIHRSWAIDADPARLLLESIQVRPAQTLAALFPDAPITVYADGLMSYGPTRNPLTPDVYTRIERVVMPDLVPGLTSLLLGEYGVKSEVFPVELLGKTLNAVGEWVPLSLEPALSEGVLDRGADDVAVIVGQYLGDLGVLTPSAEHDLQTRMLAVAQRLGAQRVLFKPHPGGVQASGEALRVQASRRGLDFHVVTTRAPLETMLDRVRPGLVISTFSTALMTASRLHGSRCVSVGTRELLSSLRPYENSNRIPLVIVDAMILDGETAAPSQVAGRHSPGAGSLQRRVRAVGYLMQPQRRADLRSDAEAVIAAGGADAGVLNVPRSRLTQLGLQGGYPGGPVLRRAADTTMARIAARLGRTLRRAGLGGAVDALR